MRKLSIYVSLLMVSALFGCELSAPPVCLPESEKCEYNSIVHSALYSKCNENGEWQVKTSCSECNGNRCVDSSPEVACETEGESRCDDVANSVSIQFTCKDRQFVPTVCPIGTKCAGTECESASVSCEDESETVCTWVENLKVSVFSFCENGKMTAVYCPEASACDGNVCGRPNVQPTVICSSENGSKCGDDELLSSWAEGVCHNGLCEVLYCIDGYTLINGDCKPAGECCGQDCINCLDKNMVCSDSSANTGTCVETCTDNRVSCQGVCIDPLTSHEYCNAGPDCAHPTKCDSDRICEDGTCVCYPGTECDGTCYDLSVTLNHCGDCETDCTELAGWADGYCMNGLCQATECEPPYQMRTDNIDGENIATCVNDSEVNSCGSDKTDCTTTVEGWVEGECRERRCIVTRCIDGQHPYTTSEESICELNDNDNCGEHAVPCQASSVTASTAAECTNSGECVATSCETGYHLYEGSCEKDDNINCGSHGTACTKDMFEWSETVSCDTGECIIISCDNNHILNGTVCIDKNCTNDATKCMNANTTGKIYKCINNEWVENRICTDNNSCNDTNTDCGVCINDKVQCADLSVQTCANGAWQEPIACTEPTNSKASCSEGVCGFKCNSNYHKTAGGDGCEINSITDCGASHTVCPKATNGSAKCSTSGVCSLYCNNSIYPDLCSSTCVNLSSDTNNCGSCGNKCTVTNGTAGCSNGSCVAVSCSSNYHTTADGKGCEKNSITDCGASHTVCPNATNGSAKCSTSGVCSLYCNNSSYPDLCSSTCVDLTSDVNNCGSCGNKCTVSNGAAGCSSGSCVAVSCNSNYHKTADGKGCEKNSITDCGASHTVCPKATNGSAKCSTSGVCSLYCNNTTTYPDLCSSTCVNLTSDVNNCGSCGNKCTVTHGTAGCSNGNCVAVSCDSNYHTTADGKGCEMNTITDCGASHTVCPKATNGSAKCSTSGVCSLYCNNSSYPDLCSSTCVDFKSDTNNCGSCGNKCTVTHGTAGCSNGSCVAVSCNSNYHKTADGKGCEINTITDCGASHTVCPNATNGSAKCSTSGVCSLYCNNSSYPDLCSSTCVDLANDVNNCGSCGNKCTGSTTVCDGGVCMAPTCGDGTAYKSQTVTTVSGTKTVKAYCIDSTSTLELVRTAINSGSVYPSNNTDNAYILVNNLSYNVTSWTPIGNSSHTFTGIFIGNNKQISFNGSVSTKILVSTSKFGVFGSTSGASIMNLNIDYGVQVDGDSYNYIGGLVGYAGGGYISNVSVYADHKNASLYLGGLVGYADGTTIVNCHTEGYLNGYLAIGGLVGHMDGRMENSYSSCTVNGGQVGGAVGRTNASTSITDCYATGKVTGAPAGGFVGASYNTTYQNCYATGDIKATGDAVGGFVGGSNGESNYYNCYATGDISGEGVEVNVGGFVGDNVSNDTYSYCYAEGEVFGDENVGGFIGSGEGLFEYCAAYGRVVGNASVGGFIGFGSNPQISYSYSHGIVVSYGGASSDFAFGGFAGYLNSGSINHCYEFGRMEIGGSGASPNNGGFIGVILDSVTVHESYYNTVACSEAVGQNSTSNLTGSLGKFTYSTGSHIPILVGSSSTTLLSALSSPYVGKTCTINGSSFPQVPIITEVMSSKYCN